MPAARAGPAVSVVIPAANEEAVIARCLGRLLADTEPGELDVVVVCNGCTDHTSRIARTYGPDVTVLETPVGSKPLALNLGDHAARTFPRLYMDADVELSVDAVRAVADALRHGGVEAAAPRLQLDATGATWAVRAYHRVWTQLPDIAGGLMARGVYAVSEEGRRRFGAFPDVIADDLFIDRLFPPACRRVIDDHAARVRSAATIPDLLHRKTRVFAGNQQLSTPDGPARRGRARDLLSLLRDDPTLLVPAVIYLAVNAEAKRRARRKRARDELGVWERDATSRP